MSRHIYTILMIGAFLLMSSSVLGQPDNVLLDKCVSQTGDEATYLKDFIVKLDAAGPGEKAPVSKHSMVLKKNTIYKFSICNAESSSGKGIIQLYDTQRMIATNHMEEKGKIFPSFEFKCEKTGVYHIFISFKEGKAGRAVGVLSLKEKL